MQVIVPVFPDYEPPEAASVRCDNAADAGRFGSGSATMPPPESRRPLRLRGGPDARKGSYPVRISRSAVLNTIKRRVLRPCRQLSWKRRALPDVIVLGAQKAGTTSLYNYLAQHPKLHKSFAKEVHYFDGGRNPAVDTFQLGEPWYRAHFPLRSKLGPGEMAFEASPLYLFTPLAPPRIRDLVPHAKLIALLRDPAERAVSHYFHEQRKGKDTLPIREAFAAEEERLAPILAAEDYKNDRFATWSYQRRGQYAEQLKRYFALFPREQVLVLNSDAMFTAPDATLRRVFEFIGIDASFTVPNLKPRNVAGNRTDVDPAVYEALREHFEPHNRELYDLLGEDYGW